MKDEQKEKRFELTAKLTFTTPAKDKKMALERLNFWIEGINKTVDPSTVLKLEDTKCKKLPF